MNHMDAVPNGYLFLTNCYIAGGSETVIKNGPHPRLTYFRLSKTDTERDMGEVKTIVFNNEKDYPSVEYDLVFLKNTSGPKRVLGEEENEPGVIPVGRML
jgi:hypothetical protein